MSKRSKVRDISSGVLRAMWNRVGRHLPLGDDFRNAIESELLERDLPGIAFECDAYLVAPTKGIQ